MVIYLERGADCLYVVQLMPLPPKTPSSLASFKSRWVLPFECRLAQVVLEKRPFNGCSSSSYCNSLYLIILRSSFNLITDTEQIRGFTVICLSLTASHFFRCILC